MNIFKRVSMAIMAFLIIFPLTVLPVGAYQVITQSSQKNTISPGVELEKVTRFTTDGWQAINIMRVDLTKPSIKAKTLSSNKTIKNLETVSTLAKNENAIAAINGSFFIWWKQSGLATPIGLGVEESKITTALSDFNQPSNSDKWANLNINNDGTANVQYLTFEGKITAPNGNTWAVGRVNKPHYDVYKDLTIQDRKWSSTSENLFMLYNYAEVVVESDIVKEVRTTAPAIEIPQNGYVISGHGDAGKFLTDNFKVGDPVIKDLVLTPDMDKINESLSGGSQLLKDGKHVSAFTHVEGGRNPQTAVGITKDKKNLIMVTVDGRQQKSIGMTMYELSEYMLTLGSYDAIVFDSGGSTTMVGRLPGNSSVSLLNNPSDGYQRPVVNGFGIVNTAPVGELAGLIVKADDENVFVNASRKLTVTGVDANNNPVSINTKDIKWSVTGVNGSFKDNIFTAKSLGKAKITAKLGNISSNTYIDVISSPVKISLSSNKIELLPNQSKSLYITGYNKDGFSSTILPGDIKWTIGGLKGNISDGTVSFTNSGFGYVQAAVGKVNAYAFANVQQLKSFYYEGFESSSAKFSAYPSTVTGDFSISNDTRYEGTSSGKLTYDFSQDIKSTRAAYVVFNNNGIDLPSGSDRLTFRVKSDVVNSATLKAEIIDAKGKQLLIDIKKGLTSTDWQWQELSLKNVSLPAKLTKLYLVQESPVPDKGTLYFDSLNIFKLVNNTGANKYTYLKDTVPVDPDMKKTSVTPNATSFSFTVFPQLRLPKDKNETARLQKLYTAIQKESEFAAFPGGVMLGKDKKPAIKVKGLLEGNKNSSTVYKGNLMVQLYSNNTNSLRLTDKSSWNWLLNTLETYKGKNIFITSNLNPYKYADSMEGRLLRDTLTEYAKKGSRIYFVYGGSTNSATMDNGVKYISVAGMGQKDYNRLRITVKNGVPSYYFIKS